MCRFLLRRRCSIGVLAALPVLGLAAPSSAQTESEPRPPIKIIVAEKEGSGGQAQPQQPQVAIDDEGRIYVAYGVGHTVWCAVSTDRGRTFGPPVMVAKVKALSLGRRRGPRIAVTNRGVVVSVIAGEVGKGRDGDLLAWRSGDAGRTWTGPARVNTVTGSAREGLHAMTGRRDGLVYATWLDLRNQRTELWGAASRDGGATWEPDRLVYRSPERSICECCHPSAAFGPGTGGPLYLMWRNSLAGNRDLYLIRSNDGGETFEPARKLGEGSWRLGGCPMDGGSVAAGPEGQVLTGWMRDQRVFTAEPARREQRLGNGNQPWIAWGPEGPVTVWLGMTGESSRPTTLTVQTADGRRPRSLADHAAAPVAAAGPEGKGPVVAAWEDTEQKAIIMSVLSP